MRDSGSLNQDTKFYMGGSLKIGVDFWAPTIFVLESKEQIIEQAIAF